MTLAAIDPAGAAPGAPVRRGNRLLWATLAAMLLGILAGLALGQIGFDPATKATWVEALGLVTKIFLRLLRMIVAPLILSTLVVGISQIGSAGAVGRIGLRTLAWFVTFSLVAIATGLALANLFTPGAGLHLAAPPGGGGARIDMLKLVEEMVPVSIVDAAAQNRIIQIVVFAVFTGVAIGAIGEPAAQVRSFADQLARVMFRIAGYVIRVAPIAVFAAMTATTLEHGLGMVATLGRYVACFYLGLAAMALLITIVGLLILGRAMPALVRAMREPLLIAFSTASSEATLPATFEAVVGVGAPSRIVGLVLPLGYAFNLDGTLIYSSFAVLFIAQAYGIDLSIGSQIGMLLFLMIANKGAAGVPRGALVTLTLTLQAFGLPVEGVALILGVEAIMDMGRTTINVFGNAVAAAAIARLSERDRDAAAPA